MNGSEQHPLTSLHIAAERDRRAQPRLSAEVLGLDPNATLSQGICVRVINVSTGGALVELGEWIRPGTRSALRLTRPADGTRAAERHVASGQILRCWVDRLAPLRYRAAIAFSASTAAPVAVPAADEDITMLLDRTA